jgi:DNA-binding winged helix-turn-helix (wHTH) protein
VALTDQEWRLVEHLARHVGQAVSREALLAEVWSYHRDVRTRTVDTTVARLRSKIEEQPSSPVHLVTVYGFGYRLDAAVELAEPATGAQSPPPQPLERLQALAELRSLAETERRIAVVGPPGVGKSRLVGEWARDRSALVLDLASSSAEDAVLSLALSTAGPEDLVLDNVDRVLPQVLPWIDAMPPERRIVVTCRQRPGARGEVTLRVGGLTLEQGIELFLARARGLGSELDPHDPAIPALVDRLGGLPLAIEYAASRTLVLSPEELLRSHVAVLGSAKPTDPRHGTLLGAVGWSWDLLEPWEQGFVSQLSVFEGGFSLQDAELVLGRGPVLDVLQSLVDKSLCRRRRDGRWEIYEILREFAADRLTLHPLREAALRQHAEWALGRLDHILAEPDPEARCASLSAEVSNLRAAKRWLTEHQPEGASRIAQALQWWLETCAQGDP